MAAVFKANNITLPSPVSFSSNDELIWSTNTGRSASGEMIGDIITQKKACTITWSYITEAQLATIVQALAGTFFPFQFRDNGAVMTITIYRGTINKEHLGYIGDGTYYYRTVTADLVQK